MHANQHHIGITFVCTIISIIITSYVSTAVIQSSVFTDVFAQTNTNNTQTNEYQLVAQWYAKYVLSGYQLSNPHSIRTLHPSALISIPYALSDAMPTMRETV
jgi:hypothetical protein